MIKKLNNRYLYLDLIKAFAIYLVCVYHFNNLVIDFISENAFSTYLNYFILGIASTGVPLFFMVNGALMLNKPCNIKKHCFKMINLTLLTVVWGMITLLVLIPIKGNSYSILGFVKALWTWEKGAIDYLWYLQGLICIYALFPVIKVVYDQKNRNTLKYLFAVLFIFTFGNVLLNMGANIAESILGVNYLTDNSKNFFNLFNVFRGFYAYIFLYFILGSIIFKRLSTNTMSNIINTRLYGIALLFGLLILFGYGVMMSFSNGETFDTVYFGYDTVMTLLMSVSIFVLAEQISRNLNMFEWIIKVIGANTLGIYFLHIIIGHFLQPYYELLPFSTNLFVNLIYGGIILGMSLGITLVLKKIPFIRWLFAVSINQESRNIGMFRTFMKDRSVVDNLRE